MKFPRILRSCLLLLAGLPLGLRAADWQALVNNSPFGQAPAASTAATGDVEFRGVVQEDGVYIVNLYNPASKTSQWIPVNGKAAGLEVKAYDAGPERVQITQAGRALTLPMKQAKVALAAATPGANAEGGGGDDARRAQIRDMIRARMQPGANGEPSPFMRNLPPEAQAMIEEFRRRRAENGGANGDQGQGGGGGGGGRQFRQGQNQNQDQSQGQTTQGQGGGGGGRRRGGQ